MRTSVVFRLAIGLLRSADTEVGGTDQQTQTKYKKIKKKRQRPQKTFLPCFQDGKENTLKYWQLLEQVEECLQHNDLRKFPYCRVEGGSNDNGLTGVTLLQFQYWSLWGDKMTLQHLIIDNATHYVAGMRDEEMGSPWTSTSPHDHNGRSATRSKCGEKKKGFWRPKIIRAFSSLGIIWTLIIISVQYSFPKAIWACGHQINTQPSGTERSESPAFDSHVVERNKEIGD